GGASVGGGVLRGVRHGGDRVPVHAHGAAARGDGDRGGAVLDEHFFLTGGIVGTFHHLYFTGTPVAVLALGATFSALEVVPLVLIGFEAYENLTLTRARPWVRAYKWPIFFFVSVAFW